MTLGLGVAHWRNNRIISELSRRVPNTSSKRHSLAFALICLHLLHYGLLQHYAQSLILSWAHFEICALGLRLGQCCARFLLQPPPCLTLHTRSGGCVDIAHYSRTVGQAM